MDSVDSLSQINDGLQKLLAAPHKADLVTPHDEDDLMMVTLNIVLDEEKKWKKLERVGLRKYFNEDNVWMVREKTPDLFREICRGRNPRRCTMVGNSVINDIRPALDAGIKTIFIPRPLFKRVLPIRIDDPKCTVLRRIDEIIDRYDEL